MHKKNKLFSILSVGSLAMPLIVMSCGSKSEPALKDDTGNFFIKINSNNEVTITGTKRVIFENNDKLGSKSNIEIPSKLKYKENDYDVVAIENEAFLKYNALESITIPSSVKFISERAFEGCENLKTVIFADNSNLIRIKNAAFQNCKNLETIILPKNIRTIDEYAFAEINNDKFKVVITNEASKDFKIHFGRDSFKNSNNKFTLTFEKLSVNNLEKELNEFSKFIGVNDSQRIIFNKK
ncbi:leucine-rich repeat domain-containing protein [Mycoplasma sp. 1331]|uniref:Leucine-rich repeat domain-containing protein n=1 Tax=Mycoplasma tauri TaxID=547987 RepID=A0A953NGF9_9MOLU|nr:leucine-rich repeat domain-containing protein [Mycoplasma tauri]MBZ4195415.1 leucine-rich repeat domain-containing protein [Mycoplasma tauri]